MQKEITDEKGLKRYSSRGIDVINIQSHKFKTNAINIFFLDSLNKQTASLNALVPAVLRRGCKTCPTFQDIALTLEGLYGASFDCGVFKKGECHMIQFYIEFVSDQYTGDQSSLFEKAFDLLYQIIFNPHLENGSFKADYVDQEKENLTRLIESRVNDKKQYAMERCIEEMCMNEPFGVYELGGIEDVNAIDGDKTTLHYKKMIQSFPMKVFVSGDVEEKRLDYVIEKLSGLPRDSVKTIEKPVIAHEVKEVRQVTEKMNINQGKLSLGFRTNIAPESNEIFPLMVSNAILGGGMHSKLFQNVREKESLAYYAFSRLEKFKGLMLISSGIEFQNKEKATRIILQQVEEMKKGNINDWEFEASINTIETGINSIKDSQLQMVDFYLGQEVTGTKESFNSFIQKIKAVTKQEVITVSQKMQLELEYFLTSEQA